jgi:hypothetical protein
LQLGLGLVDLIVDKLRVWANTVQLGQGIACLLDPTLAVCVTWRFGHENNASAKDEGPQHGKTVVDSPLGRVPEGSFSMPVDLEVLAELLIPNYQKYPLSI